MIISNITKNKPIKNKHEKKGDYVPNEESMMPKKKMMVISWCEKNKANMEKWRKYQKNNSTRYYSYIVDAQNFDHK